MSANNFILIKEKTKDTYKVSENDYESNAEAKDIGTFSSLKTAIKKAEKYISDSEIGVEYGIRFSSRGVLKKTKPRR